jgi:prepilin-type N-terminal cleavage/methylation domain-containing protein
MSAISRPSSPATRDRVRSEQGFTLIEVMIALIVFAFGALGLASVMPYGTGKVTDSAVYTTASNLTEQCCEQLLITPYNDPDLDPGNHDDPNNPYDGTYYLHWTVEADQPFSHCKRITVSVTKGSTTGNTLLRVVIVSPESNG